MAIVQAEELEEDFDGNLDQDAEKITDVEEARLRIKQLMSERQRKEDYQRRLTRKLQKLDADLAARREEVEGLQRSLDLERNKFREENLSLKKERDTKAKMQEERIREYLSEVFYTKPKDNQRKGISNLDTVLVSFVKPNESFRYNLAFRIDSSTTVVELRGSACKYWGVSADNFILRTMANNKCQDDNKVKDCFKQGEIAQLRLEMKNRENTAPPLEEELKAIQRKGNKKGGARADKGKPRYNAEGVEKIQKFGDNYASQLKKMGGVYFLLKLRDVKPSEHTAKIKLRDVLIYLVLLVIAWYVYTARRPAGASYWSAAGIEDFLLRGTRINDNLGPRPAIAPCTLLDVFNGLCVPAFNDVKTVAHVMDWLNYTIPVIFWPSNSTSATKPSLSTYNSLLGYVNLRVQNTQPPSMNFCGLNSDFVSTLGANVTTSGIAASCYARYISPDSQATDEFVNITKYWANLTESTSGDPNAIVRGPSKPGTWKSAQKNQDDHKIGTIKGRLMNYDASGYSVCYRMTVSEPTAAAQEYKKDIQHFFEQGLFSAATRLIIISFTSYNFHYDLWTATDMLFEIPPSADVRASYYIRPFRPRIQETPEELGNTNIDYVGICICIYIFLFVGWLERQHKVRNHKAGFHYHISFTGITDLGLCTCLIISLVWRSLSFQNTSTKLTLETTADFTFSSGFLSYSALAEAYNNIFIVDGMMMVFLMYRMFSFFRLNHTIYLLWHTLGKALKSLIFFTCMLVPAIAGFIIITNDIFGPYDENYTVMGSVAMQTYNIVVGRNSLDILNLDQTVTLVLSIGLYLFVTFFVLNIFATIVMDAYYVVQLTSFAPSERWDRQKIASWVLPGIITSLMQALSSPGGVTETRI